MNNAVAERRPQTVAARPLLMADALKVEEEQRKLLGEYVARQMKVDTDYGVIPGTDRKSLLKPGAEKLCSLFRCTPRFDIVEKIEDWDRPLFYYQFRVYVEANDTGAVVAEGFGSANSMEGKWRWRTAARKCPACGKEAIIKGKAEYGGGWVCFKKKDGCGAKYPDGAAEIEGQEAGKVLNDDIFTLTNTILKIAKKRALVDAAIALARCSDLFTQDVEDMDDPEPAGRKPRPAAPEAEDDGTGQAAPAMLRVELTAKAKELAGLRKVEPAVVFDRLNQTAKQKNPRHPDRLEDVSAEGLRFMIRHLDDWLAKAKAPPAKPAEREPGQDDEPAGDGAGPTAEQGTERRLPPKVVDQIQSELHDCGVTWEQARAECLGIIGRRLYRDAHLASLSLDESNKVVGWARKKKAEAEKRRRDEEAVPA